jgi:hypothetical protein
MGQPGLPGSQFPSEDAIGRRIKDLERAVQELRSANQLAPAGIRAIDGGIVVEGSMDVQGAETVSGTLDVTGDADFTGNVRIGGTLELPAGIIGNDALASPIFTSAGYGDAYGFAVPASEATIATATIAVPAGYTKATVTGIGAIYLYNSSTTATYGYGRVYVDWPSGPSNFGAKIPFALGASGGSGNSSPNRLVEKEGLSGGNITVRLVADSDNGVPAHAASQATINALVVFTR